MGIPIISEIWDGIRWLINQFTDNAPKPLKIILFLVFLLTFGNLIVWLFHLGGIHCNTDKEVVKVDSIDLVTNIKVLFISSKDRLTGETATVEEAHPFTKFVYLDSALESCTWYMKNDSGTFTICDNINTTDCKYYYRDGDCHNCSSVNVGWIYAPNTLLNWYRGGEVCLDGARYQEKNFFNRYINCESLCEIPEHYSWNYNEGRFECADLDYCGVNATKEPSTELDFILKQAGATKLYDDPNMKSYKRLITIQCTDNYNPKLTIFGIPVLDFKIWVVIFILIGMFMFLGNIKKH